MYLADAIFQCDFQLVHLTKYVTEKSKDAHLHDTFLTKIYTQQIAYIRKKHDFAKPC